MINNISNSNNVSFSGGFLVDYTRGAKGSREILENKFFNKVRHKTFDNWRGNPKQVFYMLRDGSDYEAAKLLHLNEIKTAYFPNVHTTNDFYPSSPENFYTYIGSLPKSEIIRGHKRALDYTLKNRTSHFSKAKKALKANPSDIIISSLNPHFKIKLSSVKKGVKVFKNASGEKGEIQISPKHNGLYYVRYEEHSPNEPVHYYKIDGAGNIVKSYSADEIPDYIREFKQAVRSFVEANKS